MTGSVKSVTSSLARLALAVHAFGLGMATRALAFTAYVSNEKGNSISIIDTNKLQVTKTVPVGHRPRGIVLQNTNFPARS
jgi:YVTN family beta-propeller protein